MFELIGFATLNGGTTGGEGGPIVDVYTDVQLSDALTVNDSPAIVRIHGQIDLDGVINVKSNKTVTSLGDAHLRYGELNISQSSNVIVTNLRMSESFRDCINIEYSENVWIHRNTLESSGDGLCDIKHGSNYITVSWNHFRNHVRTMLIGHDDANGAVDLGKLKTTIHNNWFENCEERIPRVRFGEVHSLNNYISDTLNGVRPGIDAQIYQENCYYDRALRPYTYDNPPSGWIKDVGSKFVDTITNEEIRKTDRPEGVLWVPSSYYAYTAQTPDDAKASVMAYSGQQAPYAGPWHVSNSGNDVNNGSEQFPFATVTHAHSMAIPGDEILLERGSIFYENFTAQTQGTASDPITFDVYGDENLPLPEICGGKVLTEWESIGNGLYNITDTGFPSRVNVMVFNNQAKGLGKFPSSQTYNQITGGSGAGTGTISDSVNLSGRNFVGGEVVARKWQWVLDRGTITAHSGSTLSFTGMTDADTIKPGWGYFVQNHRSCCTEVGDWCQEGDDIIMYFGANDPNDYNIKCSYHEQILFNDKDHNHFYNIRFTLFNSPTNHTNNCPGIATIASQGIKFFNCEFQFFYVIFYPDATNNQSFELNGCTILDTLNIVYFNRFQPQNHNYLIKDCVIDRTGLIPGAGGNGSASYSALVIPNAGGTEGNILGNRILNTGYNGININGTKFTVDKNYISHANLTKDDGGGIYSYGRGQEDETAYPYVKADRRITNNIITNVFGAPEGRPSWFSENPSYSGEGLYMDDNARQLTIQSNICFNNRDGLKLHNVKDIDVLDNIFYDNSDTQVVMPDDTIQGSFDIRGINFSGNILYANSGQGIMHLSDADSEFHLFGTFSNNYYMRPSNESNIISAGSNSYSLLEWKSNGFGYDQNSKGTPTTSTVSELALNDTLEHIIYPLERIRLDPDGMQVNEPFGLEAFTAEILLDDLGPLVPIPVDTFEIILMQINGGMATGGGTYEIGTSATLEAIPDTNWVFAGWEEGGEVIETDNPWIFPVTADRYVTPSFIYVEPPLEEYTVIATVNGSGAVSGSGVYESGSWVTLTATPSDGWLFVRWSNDLEDNPYSFTVTGDIALQAIFQPIPDPPPAYITVKGKFKIV